MSQRYMCPSVGAIGRPLGRHASPTPFNSRAFHASARKLEDKPGSSAPSVSVKDAMTGPRQPRRERNNAAATQIGKLQMRRVPTGASTGRPGAQTTPGTSPPPGAKIITPRKPFVRKDAGGAPGTMIRAPSTLKITRDAGPPGGRPSGGPNLRSRGKGPGSSFPTRGGGLPKNRGDEHRPPKRERTARGGENNTGGAPKLDQDSVEPKAIEESLMQTLYRMQRNQWDRKPYEPKYAAGSFAANELIHAGRELFKGESPPVKVWGKLEKTLNIVGMHGAAAHLQIRRVPDGDAMPFGKEHENLLETQKNEDSKSRSPEIAA